MQKFYCTDPSRVFIRSQAPYSIHMKQGTLMRSRTPGYTEQGIRRRTTGYSKQGIRSRTCGYTVQGIQSRANDSFQAQCIYSKQGTTDSYASFQIAVRNESMSFCSYSRNEIDNTYRKKNSWSQKQEQRILLI